MWRVRTITRTFRPTPVRSTEAHAALVEALLDNDIEKARSIHYQQRRRSAKEIDEIIERLEPGVF